MLHYETVEADTLALIRALMLDTELEAFRLVGGTALSLLIGHRKSVDIDLFSTQPFDSTRLLGHLVRIYQAENCKAIRNGVFCSINGIKVDILSHIYPRVDAPIEIDGIRMESLSEIGAMKLNAIVGSGKRLKDYVDIYFLLEYKTLAELTEAYVDKYPNVTRQVAHAALRYYDDIIPVEIAFMGRNIEMQQIQGRIYQAVLAPTRLFELTEIRGFGKDKGRDLVKEPNRDYGHIGATGHVGATVEVQ